MKEMNCNHCAVSILRQPQNIDVFERTGLCVGCLIKENAKLRLCLEDIAIVGIDYDGYKDVEGLKKCIDRMFKVANTWDPERFVDCDGNIVDRVALEAKNE